MTVVKQVEMPLYVEPHPLVAAAIATFLGYRYLTFPHHSSVLLFCVRHCFHACHICYAIPSSKFTPLLATAVFLTLLCYMLKA